MAREAAGGDVSVRVLPDAPLTRADIPELVKAVADSLKSSEASTSSSGMLQVICLGIFLLRGSFPCFAIKYLWLSMWWLAIILLEHCYAWT
jgi:hypothetical protein